MISRAWGWLQTGLNFGPLEAGVFDKIFDGYWTFHPLIPTWFHARSFNCLDSIYASCVLPPLCAAPGS